MSEKISYHGKIRMKGIVEIINGNYYQKAKNHFTYTTILNLNTIFAANVTSSGFNPPAINWGSRGTYMLLGSDTTTHTTFGTYNLASPLTNLAGSFPSSQSGSTAALSNGASVTFSSTWNAGAITGTVGEAGLFLQGATYALNGSNGFQPFGLTYSTAYTYVSLGSRLSVADGDFTAFTINTSNPLTINWTMNFTFV